LPKGQLLLGGVKEGEMTEKERLMEALFGDKHVTHRNIKFMPGGKKGMTEEDFCRQVNRALTQKSSVAPITSFPRQSAKIDVRSI
jgi:hypothetical protein